MLLILFRWISRTPLNTWRSLNRLDRKWNLLVVEDPKSAAKCPKPQKKRKSRILLLWWMQQMLLNTPTFSLNDSKYHSSCIILHPFCLKLINFVPESKKTLFFNSFILFSEKLWVNFDPIGVISWM